jgi:hypothetical protein
VARRVLSGEPFWPRVLPSALRFAAFVQVACDVIRSLDIALVPPIRDNLLRRKIDCPCFGVGDLHRSGAAEAAALVAGMAR